MEKIEVKFEVEKDWESEIQRYSAEVKVMLPTDPTHYLHPLFLNRGRSVAGERLGAEWGSTKGEWRVSSIYLTAADITELEEKIRKEIENMLETLKEVAEKNREARRKLEGKEREVYVYQI